MRKGIWSVAALGMVLSGAAPLFIGPPVQAAETVTMGSDSKPNDFKFFPAEITVPVGTTVVWRNLSDIPHDATAKDNSFASDQLAKGQDFSFTFKTPAPDGIPYYCSVSGHEDAGMTGVIKVTGGGGATASTAATTPTTQAGTATTVTTAAGGTTTTTAKAAAGASTTTTAAGSGATTTTLAPGVTPTSAPAGETTTTTAAAHGGGEEAAADDHASDGGHEKKEKKKNSPIGIAFASLSTVLLAAIAGKMLASKS
jgi:plastocyanin